ncbi:amino acid ABC transporter membrane protein 1, PAAT family [Desulfocurvibacter africanus PCS]|uniref:Putative glutamine transport system permease protein GlnP n=1 Tax=Desulfocurvibacter africanus PCS TaxID=1262666 RepID=M5Q237_DESAF|nr:amino acid ABC transporter permease [Desulfocurvibacter africanus]EMG37088.1 amino acid ABC transporter membrane protein 1, PAAT family [Desulfocurvibacter africanus PCS]
MPHAMTRFPIPYLGHKTRPLLDLLGFCLLLAILAWLTLAGSERLGYNWQWYRLPRYLLQDIDGRLAAGPLLQGLAVTLKITAAGLVLATLLGMTTALLRLSSSVVGRILATAYLETVRNTPLLIQILFIYFALSPVLGIGGLASGILALALFEGAYASEIIRAGIVSVERGQWEAAYSLGLSRTQAYARVVLPQALRRVLPPLTGQAVSLVKDSALVSTIAVHELTMQGQIIVADTFLTFEVWFTVAAMYLLLNISLSLAASGLERRMALTA